MRTYNVKIDETILRSMLPYFKGEDAMQTWIEKQLHDVFVQFVREQSASKASMKNNDVLEKLEAIKDDPDGFFKLDQILPPSSMSMEELREEAYFDKYGL